MFEKARIILTAWYLLIILCISLFFSGFIYTSINRELQGIEYAQLMRKNKIERQFGPIPPDVSEQLFNFEEIEKARTRVIVTLGFVNGGLLLIAGLAGYFLAGRTLRPIKKMIDEQYRFVSDSSHELRTPLTSLRSEIEVNLRNKSMTIAQAKKLLQSNLEEVISLQMLSDRLLELAQNGQSYNGTVESLKLSDVLNSAVKKLDGETKRKKITVKKEFSNIVLSGVRVRLTELFVILLDNAIKYSSPETEIVVTTKKTRTLVIVKIQDQGMGISKKDLPHIFDRFYRASQSRSKETSGYGLGLSIAREIVNQHSGSISAKSMQGRGSTFRVELPLKAV